MYTVPARYPYRGLRGVSTGLARFDSPTDWKALRVQNLRRALRADGRIPSNPYNWGFRTQQAEAPPSAAETAPACQARRWATIFRLAQNRAGGSFAAQDLRAFAVLPPPRPAGAATNSQPSPRMVSEHRRGRWFLIASAALIHLAVTAASGRSAGRGGGSVGEPVRRGAERQGADGRVRSLLQTADLSRGLDFPRVAAQLSLPSFREVEYVKLLPVDGAADLLVALATWRIVPGRSNARELRFAAPDCLGRTPACQGRLVSAGASLWPLGRSKLTSTTCVSGAQAGRQAADPYADVAGHKRRPEPRMLLGLLQVGWEQHGVLPWPQPRHRCRRCHAIGFLHTR